MYHVQITQLITRRYLSSNSTVNSNFKSLLLQRSLTSIKFACNFNSDFQLFPPTWLALTICQFAFVRWSLLPAVSVIKAPEENYALSLPSSPLRGRTITNLQITPARACDTKFASSFCRTGAPHAWGITMIQTHCAPPAQIFNSVCGGSQAIQKTRRSGSMHLWYFMIRGLPIRVFWLGQRPLVVNSLK